MNLLKQYLKNIKILILFFLFFYCSPVLAESSMQITPLGSPIQVNDEIIQNINVSFKADASWRLTVTPIDSNLTNISSPDQFIPMVNMSIMENTANILYGLEPNKSFVISEGLETGTINKRYILKFKNPETAFPGIYSGILKFSTESATNVYTVSFNQLKIQKINILPKSLSLSVAPINAMQVGYTVESASPVRILVQSNTNWRLFINNRTNNNLFNCKFKVVSCSKNAKSLVGNEYIDLKSGIMPIAEGVATTSINSLDNDVIEVKYKFQSVENDITAADNYFFDIEYNVTD